MTIHRRRFLQTALRAGTLMLLSHPAFAWAPRSPVSNPGFYRFAFGTNEVTVLSDGTLPVPARELYVNADPGGLERRMRERFLGPSPRLSINAFLINTGDRLVMIDAGTGDSMGVSRANSRRTWKHPAIKRIRSTMSS